jgi:RNA polymerase sigma factor (sigma-70 family)
MSSHSAYTGRWRRSRSIPACRPIGYGARGALSLTGDLTLISRSIFVREKRQFDAPRYCGARRERGRERIASRGTPIPGIIPGMDGNLTTVEVQRYLDELALADGPCPAEAVVRALLSRSVERLHRLCASLLYRHYPRLTRGPINLKPEELLSAVVERLIKAMREVRPDNVRMFFALANKHMRWELNDLARRLDEGSWALELNDRQPAAPAPTEGTTHSGENPNICRILQAIECLPEDEREAFNLVRIQGMTHPEAADVLDVSTKTVQRRLNQCVVLLSAQLRDLKPSPSAPAPQ